MPPTIKVNLESSASSLALNSDFSQVVIAGSHVFKIYSIGEDLTEKSNLYAAKNHNSNFSSSDVVWSHLEENKIATVATNGAVVTWDLQKSSRSKLDVVFKDHERPVNKVSFHPIEAPLLLSGLQGGLMKLFDTRKNESVTTFSSNTESVRDIQFCPHISNYFAAGTENGNVQFWDMRRPDRIENQFREHRGPVFAIDWHPEFRLWIATASRDRTIKVWDLSEPTSLYNSIKTVASVGRVKWRPNMNYHLASCALAMDCSISVWDIRRPYIPFLAFHDHRDVTSGICWQGNPSSLLSVGKDNTLICHSIEDATRPIEQMNPLALDISPEGVVACGKPKNDMAHSSSGSFKHHRTLSSSNDSFGPVVSSVNVFETSVDSPTSAEFMIESAKRYRLSGRSLAEVCEHNAAVARNLKRHQIAMTWQMVQIIYDGASSGAELSGVNSKDEPRTESVTDSDQKHVRHHSGEGAGDTSGGGTGGGSADDVDTETDDTDNHDMKLMHIASGVTVNHDYFFGDDEISQLNFDYDNLNNLDNNQEWVLPNEAFQPRTNIVYRSATPPDDFPSSAAEAQEEEEDTLTNRKDAIRNGDVSMSSCLRISDSVLDPPTAMDFSPIITDLLRHYADTGDIQMTVVLFIVLGQRVKGLIDEVTVEHWFLSYIEILHRLQLWNCANEIIKHAHDIPAVYTMNQTSTSVRVHCGNCHQSVGYGKRFCRKCGSLPSRCSVCHRMVKGLYVWCQECAHGGHLFHIQEWFKENTQCPSGCGHQCEQSTT